MLRVAIGILCAAIPATAGLTDEMIFDQKVAPILEKRCLPCHNEQLKNGNISFQDRESLLRGGAHGATIRPGNPAGSFLIVALKHEGEIQMPPGPKLPPKEIKELTDWIRHGAVWGTKLKK